MYLDGLGYESHSMRPCIIQTLTCSCAVFRFCSTAVLLDIIVQQVIGTEYVVS